MRKTGRQRRIQRCATIAHSLTVGVAGHYARPARWRLWITGQLDVVAGDFGDFADEEDEEDDSDEDLSLDGLDFSAELDFSVELELSLEPEPSELDDDVDEALLELLAASRLSLR